LNSGEGDLTQKLDLASGDELEEIANEFNIFIEEIRTVFSTFAGAVSEIEGSSNSVSSISEDNTLSIDNITLSLQSLSAQMEQTSASTTTIMEQLDEVATSVKNLDERAKDRSKTAGEISANANKKSEEISAVETNTREIIENLQVSLDAALEETKAVEKIDEITEQILKVAKTTQILSLNAHTEAARAGAAGQGFNIIADSVGQLSQQISTLVKNIQLVNQQVKESVVNLSDNVSKMTNFMRENVLTDYATFAEMGQEYSSNMKRMAEILMHVSEITEVIDNTVSGVDMQLSDMDGVIASAADEINQVHSLSMNIKAENDKMNEIAETNVSEVKSMHDEFDRFVY
ncbi:MAG: methyl-accepting chemotaxis protein, partial [Lachnospiraceae bacterium]|nr:methyl-accepting chemotaxis protein [Lachnospiraceae bacterium]